MDEKLELILFGNLEIHQAGALVTSFKSRKGQALLCYLAVTGRQITRSTLAGLLWGEMPENDARMNLSQALSKLRRYFGNHLKITRQTIALNKESDIWVDVNTFEQMLAGSPGELDIPALQEAVQLYRGDFLESFFLRRAPEFESWVMTERMRLRQLVLKTLQTLALYYASQGESGWEEAIDYAARQLILEPWEEKSHRLMMRLLALSGRRSSALKQFDECRNILKEELDVEPSRLTLRLLEQIREGELDPQSVLDDYGGLDSIGALPSSYLRESQPRNLPLLTAKLIGRRREIEELNERLTNSDARLVTIAGMGGIGKTHLALTIAHQQAVYERFRDGVFFVPLSSVTTHSRLIDAIAEQLGLSLAGSRQPEVILFDYLRDKVCLQVLDSFEQLLPEVNFISRLMQVATQNKILITSRERLKLREEWVLDLEGLPYPGSIEEAQVSDYDAIHLFSERARQIHSNFSLEKELLGVVRICMLIQGMPLALEQAASLIRMSHAAEIADQIEEHIEVLSTTLRNLPERHRSMRAVFDGSWRRLSQDEQIVLSRLSVFRGGFDREAAEQVSGASLNILASLFDKSLLGTGIGYRESTRYDLHELVRQYATERLLELGQAEFARAHDAHLEFYTSLAERVKQFLDTEREKDWLALIEYERSNLYAALQWATESADAEHALRLNAALITFWVYNSPAGEASDWLESSLSLEWDDRSRSTMRARAEALKVAGYAALGIPDLELAEARFREGYELYKNLGHRFGQAWSLRGRGFVCLIRGDLADAQTFQEESLRICQEVHIEGGVAWSLYELGNVALANADLEKADRLLEDALTIFRKQYRELGIFRSLISSGHLRRAQGRRAESKELYLGALAIQNKTRYIQFVAQIMEGLGYLAVGDNYITTAVKLFGAAQSRRDKIETERWAHQEIDYQQSLVLTKNRIPASEWQAAWDEGYSMGFQQALEFVKV